MTPLPATASSTSICPAWASSACGTAGTFSSSRGPGGFATATNQIPVLPRDVDEDDVILQTDLVTRDLVFPLSQFVYFNDDDEDGDWTANDDDDGPFDGIIIDVRCIEHFAFVLTSRGVQSSSSYNGRFTNGITHVVGGYAVGFFNGEMDGGGMMKLGVFQFGTALTPGEIFTTSDTFPNSNLTLGWALVHQHLRRNARGLLRRQPARRLLHRV